MKHFRILLGVFACLAAVATAQAQSPAGFGGTFFNGTITSTTGGAIGGTFSNFFSTNGQDYTIAGGLLTDPAPFTYEKTGANTATITESNVRVELTFTSAAAGTFRADYGSGTTQSGSFAIAAEPFTAPLINASTRTTLAANGTAITGLVIGGSGPRRVLIRAVGPGLTPLGVSNANPNPTLSLWRGGTQIATNDDWGSDANIQQVAARVGAFALSSGSRDAVILTTLSPGSYTALVRGAAGTDAGEILIETYFVD